MVKKIITKAVGLVIHADVHGNGTLISRQAFITGDRNMLRSKCLEFEWTYVGVFALDDIDANLTYALSLVLIKIYSPEQQLSFTQLLSGIIVCVQSAWEIRVNGRWLSFNFHFPSSKPYGRKDPLMGRLTESSSRPNRKENPPYFISQLDFCQQVGVFLLFYYLFMPYSVCFLLCVSLRRRFLCRSQYIDKNYNKYILLLVGPT